jgi:uncharacterized protein (DUF1697 family)
MVKTDMKNGSKIESEEYFREVRKLEARLEDYLKEEETFVKQIRTCITQLKDLHTYVEQSPVPVTPEAAEKISQLKKDAVAALGETMHLEGEAEHEKSHLLESYGALIVQLSKIRTC